MQEQISQAQGTDAVVGGDESSSDDDEEEEVCLIETDHYRAPVNMQLLMSRASSTLRARTTCCSLVGV